MFFFLKSLKGIQFPEGTHMAPNQISTASNWSPTQNTRQPTKPTSPKGAHARLCE